MHRFFSHIPLTGEIKIFPDTPHFHQIYHVFRAKKGDRMIFFEAGGNDILYEIVSIDKKSIFCFQREVIKKQELNNKKIHLFQAYPHKIATMELIVQKSVELGIVGITFFPAEYSQISELPETKQKRLNSIAQEALEQSGGNMPTHINYSKASTQELLEEKKENMMHIIAAINGQSSIDLSAYGISEIALWVGPEGGWSKREEEFLANESLHLWSFHNNILRLETASIVGLGILKYFTFIQK